jgi:hypothetical protein
VQGPWQPEREDRTGRQKEGTAWARQPNPKPEFGERHASQELQNERIGDGEQDGISQRDEHVCSSEQT